jgi:diguanylate cyclase (GGDEF)-like protein
MKRQRSTWLGPLILLCLHAVILGAAATRMFGSDLAILLAALSAAAACFWKGWQLRKSPVALQWQLAGVGLGLWAVGQIVFTYFDVRHIPEITTLDSDLYFLLFGVPILLAICSVEGQRHVRALMVTDMLQAFVVAWLLRVELFPRYGNVGGAISLAGATLAYDIENLLLWGAVGLRLFAGSRGEQRQFYRLMFWFLSAFTLLSAPLNYLNYKLGLPTGTYLDLFWDLPFLVLVFLAFSDKVSEEEAAPKTPTRPQLVILHSLPVLITAVVVVMGALLVRYRFSSGLLAILVGLGSYCLRNSLLELRYLQTQQKLTASESALQRANERLQELSYLDPLTKVANRRRFEEMLPQEWFRMMRREAPLSLLMLDLDHFKLLNDCYGHLRGDDCLVIAAKTLSGHLKRAGELLARYGGEEFAAILPDVEPEEAMGIANRMLRSIWDLQIANSASPHEGRLTLSIGVATCYPFASGLRFQHGDLVAAADRALYAAKEAGRNQVRQSRLLHGRLPEPAQAIQAEEAEMALRTDPLL